MIDLKELRLKNWLYDPLYHKVQVHCINCPDTYYDRCEPIPLTPEILLKAGFDAISPRLYRKYLTQDEILWDGSEITLRNHNQRFELNVKCVYVHQLQNIVFSLCAEELEINL